MDQPVALELPKRQRQHAPVDARDQTLQLAEAPGLDQVVEDDALPLAADYVERRLDRAGVRTPAVVAPVGLFSRHPATSLVTKLYLCVGNVRTCQYLP